MNNVVKSTSNYLSLLKPKLIILLSVTGIVAYLLAYPGNNLITFLNQEFWLLCGFVFVGITASGGALAVNNYIDRDIDKKMSRTKERASINEISPAWKILLFGSMVMLISFTLAWVLFNFITALLLIFADGFYIFIYSIWLKRTSVLSTILGGIISPIPVLVGYTAQFGYVPLQGWLVGLIVFIWTPSHTFALASKNVDDYREAGIPVLPVIIGMKKTAILTFLGGITTLIYGNFVYFIYFFNYNNSLVNIILVMYLTIISGIFFYTLLKFLISATSQSATVCFRLGHSLYLAGIFILFVTQKFV